MTGQVKIASGIFYVVAAWAATLGIVVDVGVGFVDLTQTSIPWRDEFRALLAQSDVQQLVIVLARFLGGLMLASGLAIGIMVFGPLRRNARWAKPVVIILSLGILVPQLIAWTSLGLPGPVLWLVAGLIALVGGHPTYYCRAAEHTFFGQFERQHDLGSFGLFREGPTR